MISIHDGDAVDAWIRKSKLDPQVARDLRNRFYKRSQSAAGALEAIPTRQRADATESLRFHSLSEPQRNDSTDGATRLLFRNRSEQTVESVVLRIGTGRTTLCVSSQIGCAARCRFCATGAMRMAVDLSTAEILDQLVQANRLLATEGRRVRNVVFMGMGEPLHNEAAVDAALERMLDPRYFDLAPRFVTVSTVGVPEAMVRLVRRRPEVRLALSLHAARPEVRQRLMPITRHHGLEALHAALLELQQLQPHPTMIEYLLLDEVNDRDADITALLEFVAPLRTRINLVPYNPIPDAPELRGTPRERRLRIAERLRDAGLEVTTRVSLGSDLDAACGQLARQDQRARLRRL